MGRAREDYIPPTSPLSCIHAFHTRPFLGSIPIIIQKQLQDPRVHKPNVAGLKVLSCSLPAHQRAVPQHLTDSTPQASSPPHGCRGRASWSSCRMTAPSYRRSCSTHSCSTAPRSSAPHGDKQWEDGAHISNLFGNPLLFVERLGLGDAAAHTRLDLSRDGLVRPESLLSKSRVYRVNVTEEAF